MRILILNYEYPPIGGGAGGASREIAIRLARRGNRVAVLTTRFGDQTPFEQSDGVEIHRLRVPRHSAFQSNPREMAAFMAAATIAGPKRMAAFRPEAVLAFFAIPGGPPGIRIARRFGAPCAVCFRGGDVPPMDVSPMPLMYRASAPLLRWVWRNAAALVANSEGLRRQAQAFLDLPTLVIPNGVDTERFRPAVPDGKEDPKHPVAFFAAGRLAPDKLDAGLLAVMTALAKLPSAAWRLAIAGDGPRRAALVAAAVRMGIGGNVEWLGWRPREEMPALYARSSVFVLPSRAEGNPNAVLEAQASGLAVVAPRAIGTEESIEDGRTGLLYEFGNDAQLNGVIQRIAADPQLRKRLGAAARESAETLSWDSVAEKFESLCRTLTHAARPNA